MATTRRCFRWAQRIGSSGHVVTATRLGASTSTGNTSSTKLRSSNAVRVDTVFPPPIGIHKAVRGCSYSQSSASCWYECRRSRLSTQPSQVVFYGVSAVPKGFAYLLLSASGLGIHAPHVGDFLFGYHGDGAIAGLDPVRGPPEIAGAVRAVVIYPVQRQTFSIRREHVFQIQVEIVPAVANLDAAPAVSVEPIVTGVVATRVHVGPPHVQRVRRIAVFGSHFTHVARASAPARFGLPAPEICPRYGGDFSARTATNIADTSANLRRWVENGELAEGLAYHVRRIRC
jgi:hypothetical protein